MRRRYVVTWRRPSGDIEVNRFDPRADLDGEELRAAAVKFSTDLRVDGLASACVVWEVVDV